MKNSSIQIIGHRGAAAILPENTMESFRLAFETFQADMIEFDVHGSKEGIPVVIHDPTLERTTNGQGRVSDLSVSELGRLDAGFHFDPQNKSLFPQRGKGIRIPTLEEVFQTFPEKSLAVEIKDTRPELVRRVTRMIADYGRADRTIVGSLEHPVYRQLVCEEPQARLFSSRTKVWQLLAGFYLFRRNPAREPRLVASLPVKSRWVDLTRKEWIDWLHEKGATVYFWTVNNVETARRLAENGADGVMSDDPGMLQKALR